MHPVRPLLYKYQGALTRKSHQPHIMELLGNDNITESEIDTRGVFQERYDFHTKLKFEELLDLRAHKCFWPPPPPPPPPPPALIQNIFSMWMETQISNNCYDDDIHWISPGIHSCVAYCITDDLIAKIEVKSMACPPGGHYWNHYTGALSSCQSNATHIMTRAPSQYKDHLSQLWGSHVKDKRLSYL